MQRVNFRRILFLIMLLAATATTSVMAQTVAQGQVKNANVTLNMSQVTINQLFSAITKQSGYDFLVNMELARKLPKVDVKATNEPVRNVLDRVLSPI